MTEQLVVDDLTFVLRQSQRRTTVGITVDRDGSLIVTRPESVELVQVEQVVRAKLGWVYRKLIEQDSLRTHHHEPEYVVGAGFRYLGRTFRLTLVDPDERNVLPLRLHAGRFCLRRDEQPDAAHHFQSWYISHGTPWIARRLEQFSNRVDAAPRGVQVRDLGYRWGSCSQSGLLYFHWRTVLLPPRIIDYVIAHELIHLHQPNHGAEFWHRLERVMPDYAARKDWLAQCGGEI